MLRILAILVFFSSVNVFAESYKCKNVFFDGVDAKIDVSISDAVDTNLAWATEYDASAAVRTISIVNMHNQPNRSVLALGSLRGSEAHLVLLNNKGFNIGTLNTGVDPETMYLNVFGAAGDWLRCTVNPK